MNIDSTLLKLFSKREDYKRYSEYIQYRLLEPEVKIILRDFKAYFKEFDKNEIDLEFFTTWFFQARHPDFSEAQYDIYRSIFSNMKVEIDEAVRERMLLKFQQLETSDKLRDLLDESWDTQKIKEILEEYEQKASSIETMDVDGAVVNDLDTILDSTANANGLKWRLECLNETIGPISRGMFTIVAAYVDVGKTTFAISEAAYMAQQLKDGCVLWLNNEEDNLRVYKKIWKSVLKCDEETLVQHRERAKTAYIRKMRGDVERIKFVDIRGKTIYDIKKLFKLYNPKLCVIDQIDKIANTKHKSFSDHDRLKNLYGEVRGLANEYCPIIAISQADASTAKIDQITGDLKYQLYPHHRQLDGSKVGKPGEADAIIMIGRRDGSNSTRGIHISKNKFGDVAKREVIFNGAHARYENA